MKNTFKSLFILVLVIFWTNASIAQLEAFENIEELKKKGFFKTYFTDAFKGFTDFGDPFVLSGGVGLNLRSYSASGVDPRQDPFFYGLNANLNMRIYKFNLPFSLMVTAKNKDSSLPNIKELVNAFKDNIVNGIKEKRDRFIRFGASPSYKWIKLHIGHRSMDFSKFTLSNINFYGVGGEFTPANWRFSFMKGRLAKAEPIDLSLTEPNLPVYQRSGWGVKLGYGTENKSVDFILFKAADDFESVIIPAESENQVSPQENAVVGLNTEYLFLEKVRLKAEFALSEFSPNSQDADAEGGNMLPGFIFRRKQTSESKTALDVKADFEASTFTVGVQVKRIDPNYNSLGAYFFNNDVLDILGNLNFGLLNNSINTTISAGVQSNNLDFSKPTTTSRFVATIGLAYSKDALSANLNYSNNATDVAYVLNQNLDSLNAVIVTNDLGGDISYSIPDNSGNQHVFSLSGNIQRVSDDIVNPVESASSKMMVANFVYNYALAESKWKFSTKFNFNQNKLAGTQTKRYGTGFGVSKSLLEDKMNVGFDFNYFINTKLGFENTTNMNGQVRWSYSISSSLTSNFALSQLRTANGIAIPFSELTGTFGIQYNFNWNPSKKKEESSENSAESDTQ